MRTPASGAGHRERAGQAGPPGYPVRRVDVRSVIGWSPRPRVGHGRCVHRAPGLPPSPLREALVPVAFGVVLVSLLLQGLTIPPLIRALGVGDDESEEVTK